MIRFETRLSRAALTLGIVACLAMPAGTAAGETTKVGDYTCKEIMIVSGTDRDIAIAFLQGYVVGTRGESFDPDAIGAAADTFIDQCLDNPTAKALDVLQKAYK